MTALAKPLETTKRLQEPPGEQHVGFETATTGASASKAETPGQHLAGQRDVNGFANPIDP